MMGEIKFVGALLMTSLFGIALIIFAVNFAVDNNAQFSLGDQDGFEGQKNELLGDFDTYRTQVVNSSDSFYESEISEGENVRTGGHFKLGPGTALTTTQGLLKQSFKTIFGNDENFAVIFNTLVAFLGFIVVLLIWKTWKGGNPE